MKPDTDLQSLASLTDDQLIAAVTARARTEHRAVADLIAALAELDSRRLFLPLGYSSLFAYCTEALHLSEHAAYNRIEAARAARKFPLILRLLGDGSVTLTTITLLGPHLTDENHEDVLRIATHRSRREVELLVAALRPLPAVPTTIRNVPPSVGQAGATAAAADAASPLEREPAAPAVIVPLSTEQFRVQFTMTCQMHDRLRRVQELLSHAVPDGDPAEIFDRALSLLLHDLERRKLARTNRPRGAAHVSPATRYVPAAVRREVWARDGGRCAFIGIDGRCQERAFLELHHLTAFADGGEPTVINLELRCRAHNHYEAGRSFGGWLLRESRPSYETRSEPGSGPDDRHSREGPAAVERSTRRRRPPCASDHRTPLWQALPELFLGNPVPRNLAGMDAQREARKEDSSRPVRGT
jgi:hypothetical protein